MFPYFDEDMVWTIKQLGIVETQYGEALIFQEGVARFCFCQFAAKSTGSFAGLGPDVGMWHSGLHSC